MRQDVMKELQALSNYAEDSDDAEALVLAGAILGVGAELVEAIHDLAAAIAEQREDRED